MGIGSSRGGVDLWKLQLDLQKLQLDLQKLQLDLRKLQLDLRKLQLDLQKLLIPRSAEVTDTQNGHRRRTGMQQVDWHASGLACVWIGMRLASWTSRGGRTLK